MEVAEFHGRVMASRLHIIVVDVHDSSPPRTLEDALQDAVTYLEHLERCWSRFNVHSDVSRINQLGPCRTTVSVDPSTLTLLEAMIEGHLLTGARFDPTVLRCVIAEGYGTSHVDPTKVSLAGSPGLRSASLLDLELDRSANTVTVPAGLVVDAGGIGKGLAADLAVARLIRNGVDGAMVEIGGDLAMAGSPVDPAGWLVDVEQPDPADGVVCSLAVSGGGVATSSVRSRRWLLDGLERHHQIDPRTATCSSTDLVAVTVIARAGWLAEVHATAALAARSEGVIPYLDQHGLSGIALEAGPMGNRVTTTHDLDGIDFNVAVGV